MSRPNVTKKNTIPATPKGKPGDKKQANPRRVKAKATKTKKATTVKSRAQMKAMLEHMVNNGMMTKAQMLEKLELMGKKGMLTDGSRSKGIVESALFKAGNSAVSKTRRKGSPSGCAGFINDAGKKVIVYVTTAIEGSKKYTSLSKDAYANTDRLLTIERKKNATKDAK